VLAIFVPLAFCGSVSFFVTRPRGSIVVVIVPPPGRRVVIAFVVVRK
jgi:hypothetical protein